MSIKNVKANKTNIQSICIDRLRIVFVVILVVFHTYSNNLTGAELNKFTISGFLSQFCLCAFNGDSLVAVYFFISGFLFFNGDGWSNNIYIRKLKSRVKTLLLPYILWNILAIFLVVLKTLPVFQVFLSYPGTSVDFSLSAILSCFWMYNGMLSPPPAGTENYDSFVQIQYYPINTALWYIRDLMIVVICSPLIYYFIKKFKGVTVMFVLVLYIIFSFYYVDWHINQLLMAFLFFSIGAYVRISGWYIYDVFKNYVGLSVITYVICTLGCLFFTNKESELYTFLKIVHPFATIICAFGIMHKIVQRKIYGGISLSLKWGALSTFIYMSHCLVIERMLKFMIFLIRPDSDCKWSVTYIASIILTIVLLSLCFFFFRKFFPSALKILIGRL